MRRSGGVHRAQVAANRAYAVREMDRIYLLRGLITCGECGSIYVGSVSGRVRNGAKTVYYRCNSRLHRRSRNLGPCAGRPLAAKQLEALVWLDCRDFIMNSGATLAAAQAQLCENVSRRAKR